MDEISLTTSELNRLNEISNGGTNNFPTGYRYLSSVIASRPNPSTFSPQSFSEREYALHQTRRTILRITGLQATGRPQKPMLQRWL